MQLSLLISCYYFIYHCEFQVVVSVTEAENIYAAQTNDVLLILTNKRYLSLPIQVSVSVRETEICSSN